MGMCWPPALAVPAILAILGAILGTDRLGRALTNEERARFGALLREHDYPGARLVALRFAYKLARSRARPQDLIGRVDLRLVRLGWDPNEVSLVRRLCRLVWSEWTHATGVPLLRRDEISADRWEASTPSRKERAELLRRQATDACRAHRWGGCRQALDDAQGLDPAREETPPVSALRKALEEAKTPRPLPPTSPDKGWDIKDKGGDIK
jgi:hypothetical protein